MRDRLACISDLNNYFKKTDLLKGLTTTEKAKLRENIGIIDYTGEGGQATPINLTYNQFWNKYHNKDLITGAIYAITDFQTIYASNVYNNAGQRVTWGKDINPSEIWKIYVCAVDNDQIDRRISIDGKDWEVEYNPEKVILPDGTANKGTITYLADSNGNSAYYDFKNIRWNWEARELTQAGINSSQDLALYTFSNIVNGEVQEASELHNTKHNNLGEGCYNNIFIGDTYYNIIAPECYNNLFAKGCHDSFIKWNSANNVFNEPVCYLTGSIYNQKIPTGETVLSTAISKTIHKVNEATIVSFLDPITYTHQVVIL